MTTENRVNRLPASPGTILAIISCLLSSHISSGLVILPLLPSLTPLPLRVFHLLTSVSSERSEKGTDVTGRDGREMKDTSVA